MTAPLNEIYSSVQASVEMSFIFRLLAFSACLGHWLIACVMTFACVWGVSLRLFDKIGSVTNERIYSGTQTKARKPSAI
jgi:hypothetical protein